MTNLNIKIIKKNSFHANTYVIESESTAIIVDAGASVDELQKIIKKPVKGVLITHSHFDHIWYLEEYANTFDCPIFMTKEAYTRLDDAGKNLSQQFCDELLICKIDEKKVNYIDNTNFCLGNIDCKSILTPGHSDCSVTYLIGSACFSGDLLFEDGIGRTDFEDGNIVKLYRSMKQVLQQDIEEIYPGHGFSFTKNEFEKVLSRRSKI